MQKLLLNLSHGTVTFYIESEIQIGESQEEEPLLLQKAYVAAELEGITTS